MTTPESITSPDKAVSKVTEEKEPTYLQLMGESVGLTQGAGENDEIFKRRVAGGLRAAGRLIEAQELSTGKRWNAPDQHGIGPMAGIVGAIYQAKEGFTYTPDPADQVDDDRAVGYLVMQPETSAEDEIGAMMDLLGPETTLDIIAERFRQS